MGVIGPPEILDVDPEARYFTPSKGVPNAELKRGGPPPEVQPHLARPPAVDGLEAFLATLFLRRYVAYCAKRRRYSQMEGAVRLHRELAATADALFTQSQTANHAWQASPAVPETGPAASSLGPQTG
jgi:hypothetical protein